MPLYNNHGDRMSKIMDEVIYKLECDGYQIIDMPKLLNISSLEFDRYKEDAKCIRIKDAVYISKLLDKSLDYLYFDTNKDVIVIESMPINNFKTFLTVYNDAKTDNINYPVKNKYNAVKWDEVRSLNLGQKIELVRDNIMGWSYTQMGKKFNTTGPAVQHWELPTLSVMKRIVEISEKTGVSIDFLLKDDQPLSFTTYQIIDNAVPLLEDYVKVFGK